MKEMDDRGEIFLDEIREQGLVIARILKEYTEDNGEGLRRVYRELIRLENESPIDRVYIIGIGSSYFAGLIGEVYYNEGGLKGGMHFKDIIERAYEKNKGIRGTLEDINGTLPDMVLRSGLSEVRVMDAGEFYYHFRIDKKEPKSGRDLYIFISQSGESTEIRLGLKKLKDANGSQGIPSENIWGITNYEESTLSREAGFSMYLYAGEEKSVTSKTYVATILVINIFMNLLSAVKMRSFLKARGHFNFNNSEDSDEPYGDSFLEDLIIEGSTHYLFDQFRFLSGIIDVVRDRWDFYGGLLREFFGLRADSDPRNPLRSPSFIEFLSRGTGLATCGQGALNMKEVAKIKSESLSLSMFRHGCIEVIDDEFRAVIVLNDKDDKESVESLINSIIYKWDRSDTCEKFADENESKNGNEGANEGINESEKGKRNKTYTIITNSGEIVLGYRSRLLLITNTDILLDDDNDSNNYEEADSRGFGQGLKIKIVAGGRVMVINHGIRDIYLSPIVEILFVQILFYHLAKLNGFTPGVFRYSSKIT